MNRIFQTRFGDEGNCMQAAVASFFELPLAQVPDFAAWPDTYIRLQRFFSDRGFELRRRDPEFSPRGYYFVTGTSERGGEHMVIYRNGKLAHDPHPGGNGLVMRDEVLWPYPMTDNARVLTGASFRA